MDPSQARISRVSSASPAPEQLSTARLETFKIVSTITEFSSFFVCLYHISNLYQLAEQLSFWLTDRINPESKDGAEQPGAVQLSMFWYRFGRHRQDKRLGRILQVVLQVNISVSRPGAAHRPSEQPSLPARPTSNGLPVAVAQQPVNKVPAQVAVQVVRPRNLPRLLRLSILSPPSPSLYQPSSHMQPSSPNHLRALAILLISTALLLTACLQVISCGPLALVRPTFISKMFMKMCLLGYWDR